MTAHSVSVALCTYNGAACLGAQLASIAQQSRAPAELIVCDDRSSDGTCEIVREFSRKAPFPVRLEVNERNLGSTQNFAQAIEQCSGNIIALSDQDDVWFPQKLAQLEAALVAKPDAGFVFSDAVIVDANLMPLGYTLWEAIRFNRRSRQQALQGQAFDLLLKSACVTGATMAFRAQYRDLILPIPQGWVHDAWMALLISAIVPCTLVQEPLLQYRQHPSQQIGEKKRGVYGQYQLAHAMGLERFQRDLHAFSAALERLTHAGTKVAPDRITALQQKVEHCRARVAMREGSRWQRLPLIAREMRHCRYGRYSLGWKSIAQDLFL